MIMNGRKLIRILASLRFTLVGFLLLLLVVLLCYFNTAVSFNWLTPPLLLLVVNLIAALLTNPRFRQRGWLLTFHISLLVVLLLAVLDLWTGMTGRIELAEGQQFDPNMVEWRKRGWWHLGDLEKVSFKQGRVEVDYAKGLVRQATRSYIVRKNHTGFDAAYMIGDRRALEIAHYRFLTTPNKGYAVLIRWHDAQTGKFSKGFIHFPSYPAMDWKQTVDWTPPGGKPVRLELELPGQLQIDQAWTLSSADVGEAKMLVMQEEQQRELRKGDWLTVPGGELRFDGVRLWIGYQIDYQPLLPWLFGAALLTIIALAVYFSRSLWYPPLKAENHNLSDAMS